MRRPHVIALGAVMAMLAVAAGLNCTTTPPVAIRTECGSAAFACFDGLAYKPADSILYRPISRWPRKSLTWRMANFLPNLNQTKQLLAASTALSKWELVSDLRFENVDDDADITISFEQDDHGDVFAFDGPGR